MGRTMAPAGPGDILHLIREGAVSTRRDITTATGLSRVTVAQRVDALRGAGLVYESGPDESTGGRRPARLSLNQDHGLILAAVLDTTHAELTASNLANEVIATRHRDINIADGGAAVLDRVMDGFRGLLRQCNRHGSSRVDGVGLSVPGPVDPRTARASQPPLMPGWDDYDVTGHIQRSFDVPVVVENDANATALGEHVSHHRDASPLALIKVSTGIGCGIVVNGCILTGVDGGSGDIGHVRLDGHDDAVCTCGSRGCLAAVASGRAVAARLCELGRSTSSGSDVRKLLQQGDVEAGQLTREAGRHIGRIASTLVSLINPGVLVITGDLASPALLAGIQESIYELSLPRAVRHLRVTLGGLGESAAQVGLTQMVADKVLDPAAVDAQLGHQQDRRGQPSTRRW